jgi:deazaflavin-dependent oxidoreductase (nitroreductase family)
VGGRIVTELKARLANVMAALLRVRWLVRAPILLYRLRLGVVLGERALMLEHIGRRSGRIRWVVLEVVDHPTPTTYVVVSGFGAHSQWYRNIRSQPQVRVSVRSHPPVPAVARVLDRDEATAALDAYARRHPTAWASLRPVLERTLGVEIQRDAPSLPMVALELRR